MPGSGALGPPPREKAFRNVNHSHGSSANRIGRSNYGGRASVNPQSGNGVRKKIEPKFKPTIVKKEFNWELPADPDPKSDNYYNGIVSKELADSSNIGETLLGVIRRESVRNQSDFVNEGVETILDRLGLKTDKPLTRKEKLLAFIGFKAGSMWERFVEDQSQTEPASPNPIEWIMMLIPRTNGKVC